MKGSKAVGHAAQALPSLGGIQAVGYHMVEKGFKPMRQPVVLDNFSAVNAFGTLEVEDKEPLQKTTTMSEVYECELGSQAMEDMFPDLSAPKAATANTRGRSRTKNITTATVADIENNRDTLEEQDEEIRKLHKKFNAEAANDKVEEGLRNPHRLEFPVHNTIRGSLANFQN